MCACILYLCMFGLTIILTESRWPCDFVEAQVSSMLKSLWHIVILSNQSIQKCNSKMKREIKTLLVQIYALVSVFLFLCSLFLFYQAHPLITYCFTFFPITNTTAIKIYICDSYYKQTFTF
jgi:hypothetical protein